MNQTLGTKWYVRQCVVGAGICLCVYALALSIVSVFIVRGIISEAQTERCVWIGAAVASLTGATLCGRKTVKRGGVILGCASCFYLFTLLMGFLIGGTLLPSRTLWLSLPIFGGAGVSYLALGKNARKKKTKRRGKVRR